MSVFESYINLQKHTYYLVKHKHNGEVRTTLESIPELYYDDVIEKQVVPRRLVQGGMVRHAFREKKKKTLAKTLRYYFAETYEIRFQIHPLILKIFHLMSENATVCFTNKISIL